MDTPRGHRNRASELIRSHSVRAFVLGLGLVLALACGSDGAANRDGGSCSCSSDETCIDGQCLPATCGDLVVTGNETDIDCGGACAPCTEGQSCLGYIDCASQFCADGVCRDCMGDEDCATAPGTYCNGGMCTERLELGDACDTGDQCTSGYCVDGVCCDGPCDGECESCGSSGACDFTPAGGDSEGDCTASADGTCGLDGTCDGSGGCRFRVADTECDLATCGGGGAGACDGEGLCDPGGVESCDPYVCGASDTCLTSCSGDEDCVDGYYCAPGNTCEPKAAQGAECSSGAQCQTGHCVDGVCCSSACTGTCRTCAGNGSCSYIDAGVQSLSDCPTGSTCGNTGACNGAGGCTKASSSTVCQEQSCSNSTEYAERTCDGLGNCDSGSPTSCGDFRCSGDSCRTSCSDDSHCQTGYYCDSPSCEPKKSAGASCSNGDECISDNCANGVCCNTACTGTCSSCLNAHTGENDGTCADVTDGTDPLNDCAQQSASTCGRTGACENGGCQLYDSSTVCASAACSGDDLTSDRTCNGSGTCQSASVLACSPYTCENDDCLEECANDTDCASGHVCAHGTQTGATGQVEAGTCLNQESDGSPCLDDAQCPNGFCGGSGYCCNGFCIDCEPFTGSCGDGEIP